MIKSQSCQLPFLAQDWTYLFFSIHMRRIPFRFFARVILLTASSVLGVMSLSTHTQSQEFVYAGAAIAAAMLAGLFPRKNAPRNPLIKPIGKRRHHIGPPRHVH